MSIMRTTLTIEPAIMEKLKDVSYKEKKSFKQVVNESLERGLMLREKPQPLEPFKVEAKHCDFMPGIDQGKLNLLVDNLETETFNDHSTSDPIS